MGNAQPAVGIIMGSQSDWDTMRHAAETLETLGVAHERRIVSAHRTPKRLVAYAEDSRWPTSSPSWPKSSATRSCCTSIAEA